MRPNPPTAKVSIVIPVYNGANYLEKTLTSIKAQTHTQWEAILVDDSSTDNSYEILQEFAEKDHRFKVYRKQNQRFACYGIRYGVERATGDWFCYMSQDDRLSVDFLEKTLVVAMETGADIALGRMVKYHDEAESEHKMPFSAGDTISGLEAFELSLNWRIHGFYLIKMRLMKSVGISTGLLNDDEYDTRRHFFFAQKVTFSDGIFYYHDGNPNAITKKWDMSQLDYIKVAHNLRLFARENGVEHTGQINKLLKGVIGDACLRAAIMSFVAYRNGYSTPNDINQVLDTITEYREEWAGTSSLLKAGITARSIFGNRIALTCVFIARRLREKICG